MARDVGIVAMVVVIVLRFFLVIETRFRFSCLSIFFEARMVFAVVMSTLKKSVISVVVNLAAYI